MRAMKSDMPETGSGGPAGPTLGKPATDTSPTDTHGQPQANGHGPDGSTSLSEDEVLAAGTDFETLLDSQSSAVVSDDETATDPVLLVGNPAATGPSDDELLQLAL